MNNIESFSGIEEADKSKSKDNDSFMKRYEVSNPHLSSPFILPNNNNEKKKKCPLLLFALFFALLILICLIISIIIIKIIKKGKYELSENAYLKPDISNHNYTNITFDNKLELLLIQVDENDTAGGAIVFDTGYLDTKYEPGFLKLAILSLITYEMQKSNSLIDYLGNFEYSIDEHYSYCSFKILNAGFFQYLEIFSKLTYLEDDSRYENITDTINILNNKLKSENKKLEKRENHLLEYLIYGYKYENGTDIFPDGNVIANKNIGEEEKQIIKKIMKSLLNPSKIKIVLNSHYKMSLMKTKFLRYFQNIINKDNQKTGEQAYNISNFTTNKMIYMQIENYQTNFIKINYYINQKNNNGDSIFINKGYLNYLKYILDETNPDSLYYNLTHSDNFNIKSLSCDIDVILKSKIKFSINIYLNSYSYQKLKDIILIVYNYMDELTKYIKTLKDDDNRKNELFKIIKQNFSFTEDLHDITSYNPKKGINLFCKNDRKYFLRDIWLPSNFTFSELNEYTSQLTRNNSVLIIGINNYTLNKHFNNSELSYLFNNTKEIDYYNFKYNINDLDIIFENNNNSYNKINFQDYKNEYISKYSHSNELEYNPQDLDNYRNLSSERIGDTNFREFYFKRDTSFKIPKVFITLYFFHPFMRPNSTKEFNDQRFFEIMLYMSYIKREININLSDAIRAGNSISMFFNQNLFYIDIFAYSDMAIKILEIIKNITLNIDNNFKWDNETFFEIYRDAALEDYLNFETISQNIKMRLTFYEHLYNDNNKTEKGVYNYFQFPREQYLNIANNSLNSTNMDLITSFVINGHIFGYYNLENATYIYNLFSADEDNNFNNCLESVDLNIEEINSENFAYWMKKKNNLEDKKKEINISNCEKNIIIYRFLHWSTYDSENKVWSDIFIQILNEALKKNDILESYVFSQGEIYVQFNIKSKLIEEDKIFKDNVTKEFNTYSINYHKVVDVVGDRFYYLIRSYLMDLYSKREDMKSSAIARLNSNLYYIENYQKLDEMKNKNYDDFSDYFTKIYDKEFHIDFKCENDDK